MIDAHQHCWRIGRNDCAWPPPELAAIHRDCEPEELVGLARPLAVEGSVLVQSQPSARDTDYLLDLAAGEPFIRAVVGWVDLAAHDAPERIAALARRPKFRGLRPMLQALAQDDWILQPALAPALDALEAHGLALDALVRPRHLPVIRRLAEARPGLRIVLDHAAKPEIAEGRLDPWRAELQALAQAPNVACKLSGLLTEAAPDPGQAALQPYVDYVLACFRPDRVLWGSDWPVVELSAGYAEWLALSQALLAGLDAQGRRQVFGDTARVVYRIEEPT